MTAEEAPLAQDVLKSCGLAPIVDATQAGASIATAGVDHTLAKHAEVEPDLLRRLLGWDAPEPPNECLVAYHKLRTVRPDVFELNRARLVCLDRPQSRFHL